MTSTPETSVLVAPSAPGSDRQWWRDAVIYQVYPRSFADADGDGMGDLPGVTSRLPYLKALGVDAVWLSPFYVSPQADAGYDVADYRDVDPVFGGLDAADEMLRTATDLGLRIIVDLVPNHTSDEHAWFAAAVAAGPGSPERARYLFRDGKGTDGSKPPNNWKSVFGGSAWTRVAEPDGTPGQWYLHLFDRKQPDLDWDNPEVVAEFHDVLRYWLDRGVAGFRVDVAHGLVKAGGLPDWEQPLEILHGTGSGERPPMWDQERVHDVYRDWRRVLEAYDGDRILVAEAWVEPAERLVRYVRPDEMHQAFNFDYLEAPWRAADQRQVIEASLVSTASVGAPTTWVLSNHDVIRHATRLALPVGERRPNGIGADDPQPDPVLGLRRARAATLLMLSLPGSAYVYQGEELGLPEHTTLPDHVRQDPSHTRSGFAEAGRDGCRVPIPWSSKGPTMGFGPGGSPWLPQPEVYRSLAVDAQDGVEGSTLEMYRSALRLRRELSLGVGGWEWVDAAADVVHGRNGTVHVLTNFGPDPVARPEGELLLASGALEDGAVPSDTTVWVRSQ